MAIANDGSQLKLLHEKHSESAKPILKWAGGKTRLLPILRQLVPKDFCRYVEPFLGGGALLFDLAAPCSIGADSNGELVHFYEIVRDEPMELLEAVSRMVVAEEEYYKIRALNPESLDSVSRAARFLYLNKTCYNGLHRVNRKGIFNTPFGGRIDVTICDHDNLLKASKVLSHTKLYHGNFDTVLDRLQPGDFVYLDPPYVPLGGYSDFSRYTSDFFNLSDQRRLAQLFASMSDRGVKALLSNSSTQAVEKLYSGYPLVRVQANRQISCRPNGRGPVIEFLIANYEVGTRRGIS